MVVPEVPPDPVPSPGGTDEPLGGPRGRILHVARDVFAEHGLDGARTRDIAAGADVNQAVLYRLFRSKQEVFEAAILAPIDVLAKELLEITSEFWHLTPGERLEETRETHRRLILVIVEIAPLLGVALFSNRATGAEFYVERLGPVVDKMAAALAEAMTPSVTEVVEPRTFFVTLLGLYLGLAQDARIRGTSLDVDDLAADFTDAIAFGLLGAADPFGATSQGDRA